ncbi:MAG: acyl-CoA thioesterase [Arenicellales bacterium]|nr:acyl-CoA thioesterase [Arenicellales bacterium]MDP6552027.1 acyl-CoA thioesterase [Arenicellales bacterium]MDP6791901.1 acyl-CoA thioesterase [Arenicellales bacterium]MDP6919372.1 acyl-CoA thioesterase [Arenicellales bacterium]
MYPFVRAGRVFGRALTTRLDPDLRSSRIAMRVWPNDLDTNAHMNNGRYLTLMDLGRFDLMTQCGLVSTVFKKKWFPVAGGVVVRFDRPLHAFEKITLNSSIIGWDEKWLYFRHDIMTGAALAARAIARGLFRMRGKSVPTTEILEAINYDGPPLTPPESVRLWMQADQLMREESAGGEA